MHLNQGTSSLPCSVCSSVKWNDQLGPWGRGESDWEKPMVPAEGVNLRAAGLCHLQVSCSEAWAQCCHVSLGPGNTMVLIFALFPPASADHQQYTSPMPALEPGIQQGLRHACQIPKSIWCPDLGCKHHPPIPKPGLLEEMAPFGTGKSPRQAPCGPRKPDMLTE